MTLIGCVFCVFSPASVEIFFTYLFTFYFEFIYIFFYQSLIVFVSKIQKHIKSRKSKKFDQHYCALSHICLALYLHTNSFVHLQA